MTGKARKEQGSMTVVTLAYPWQGHQPDESVELPPDIARQLVQDGRARYADTVKGE